MARLVKISRSLSVPIIGGVGVCAMVLLAALQHVAQGDEVDREKLGQTYQADIRPLLLKYCQECHGADRTEAEINYTAIESWADASQHTPTWQKAAEMLGGGLMPPEDANQPTDIERARLLEWLNDYLTLEASGRAGDPGRVVLRRLSNAEYTYTLRDLTGVDALDPASQFPVDGAAGEGFTNTGAALVMSPALLTKYLDAAKEVASHAVLLPDGFRFSPNVTPRDWTADILADIRGLYRQYTQPLAGVPVNLQGVQFDTNEGGQLPLEKYLAATLRERESLASGSKTIEAVAKELELNARYLGTLWSALTVTEPSLVLDGIRARWRAAKPEDAAALVGDIAAWQKGLWSFATVGHIGKVGGPKRWLEAVNPLVTEQEVRFQIPAASEGQTVTLSLVATNAGDGNEHDFVVWQRPRLVAPGRPDLLLRDVRAVARQWTVRRAEMFASTAAYLSAAAEAAAAQGPWDLAELAQKHQVDPAALRAWLDYVGIASGGEVALSGHFTQQLTGVAGYEFVSGWGGNETPLLVANSSDQHVRIPGNMKPHGVAVHPSPTLRAAVGWSSPVTAAVRISGVVTHAHPECGNGVNWLIELRRGSTRKQLASGKAQGGSPSNIGPLENVAVQAGDLVSLLIASRDGNHSCDLTAIDLEISGGSEGRNWDLANDVSSNVTAGNPHADRFGNAGVWHFYTEQDRATATGQVVPPDSLLAKWQAAESTDLKKQLALEVQSLLTTGPPTAKDSPDASLYRQLASIGGPLFGGLSLEVLEPNPNRTSESEGSATATAESETASWGLDPALFGKHPNGEVIDADNLCVRAPSVIEITLPADLVAGCELVATGVLEKETGAEGSVQLSIGAGKATGAAGLLPSGATVTLANGKWSDDNRRISYSAPILVSENSDARRRIEAALDEFRQLFPAAVTYTKIVPVDEAVTLTLYHREDDHLARLMLDEAQSARLDQLWDELHYVSRDALTQVDAFAQLMEYATQDADPSAFEPLREPFNARAAAFRQLLLDSEPRHVDALLDFAARANRRPLTAVESSELRAFYDGLRSQEIAHEDAFRMTLARVFLAPAFLYRVELPIAGTAQSPISDWELASRLSYFLWSSQPDDELRQMAAAGDLHNLDTLVAQARRMLRDGKTRRLAREFACQWFHIRDFEQFDEKSERHFPTFVDLRDDMLEESTRFFTDLFQNNGSVLDIINADYTFLNEELANHYGIPGVTGGEWRRVDGVKQFSRGGILAQATTLAMQSGASRTSPILRGTWISETILGERLPKPPPGVPLLPEDEADTNGLTVRELVEKHVSDPKCAVCHRRIDPYGFSLEAFDAIGRHREKDLGNRPINTQVTTMDGTQFDGLDGLRNYLLTTRREAFLRQFCRKLLGYALGRGVQLSDRPLLAEMQKELEANDYKFAVAVEAIVRSPQFREIRGRDTTYDE